MKRKSFKINKHYSSEEEEQDDIKTPSIINNRKKPQLLNSSSTKQTIHSTLEPNQQNITFSASGTAASIAQNTTFRTLDVDGTEELQQSQITKPIESTSNDSSYSGLSNYKEYINAKSSTGIRIGPVRSAAYVRMSSRFDYAPDVCKDYKETGFCGYGDSCKFLHDRGDYKHGWQIDREWDIAQKKKQHEALNPKGIDPNDIVLEDADDEEDSQLPFACYICRNSFRNPIVTKCGHYFCEECALGQFKKGNQKCFVCGINTMGVFNAAKELQERLEKRRNIIEQKTAEAKAAAERLELELEKS